MEDLNRYVPDLTSSPELDSTILTFDNQVSLYSTPNFRHTGIIVKRSLHSSGSEELFQKEASSITRARELLGASSPYKVPELLCYIHSEKVLVMQRLYGSTAFEVSTQFPRRWPFADTAAARRRRVNASRDPRTTGSARPGSGGPTCRTASLPASATRIGDRRCR